MTSIAAQRLQWKFFSSHGDELNTKRSLRGNIRGNELFETAEIRHSRGNKQRTREIEPWGKVLSVPFEIRL
jgi:hypothetical protein